MKKITIIISLIFLLISCNNINKDKNLSLEKKLDIEIEEEIKLLFGNESLSKKENLNSPYIIKKIQTYSWEIEIIEEKKEFLIYILEEESWEEHKYLEVHNFSDEKYKEFEKYKNVESFRLSIYSSNWKKWIEKTFNYIKNNFFKWVWEYMFTLEDYKFNFTDKEIEILSQINISYLELMWVYPHISFPNPSDELIKKYKKEKTEFDNNIKYILNNSKTLNRIIVVDYKMFTKKDLKIEIEDLRMSAGWLQKLGL